jgi:hypothetical protein
MGLTEEQKERLNQWCNVYGSTEKCVEAVEGDPVLQRLLEFELASDPISDEARAIRQQIIKVEACHRRCKQNVEDLLRMIGSMKSGSIPGCGEADAELVAELRETMASAAAWADGKAEESGVWADTLGEPTPEKRWLVACLCKTVAKQLEAYQGVESLAQPEWPVKEGF